MKVCYVDAYYDSNIESGDEFVDRIYTVREFAREQAKLGAEVSVLQLFHRDEEFTRDRVSYNFIRPSSPFALAGNLVSRYRSSTPPAHYQLATRLVGQLRRIQPDVVHFYGLGLDLNLWLVSRATKKLGIPLVVQYNGGLPPAGRLRRAVQRGNLRRVDRFLFTTREHTRPWIEAGMPLDPGLVVEFMEQSSTFEWQPRHEARQKTGMWGDPVFLWTGRLHPEKDPLTALRGFERILRRWPESQFYLYYLTDELFPDLQRYIQDRPRLAPRVHFCGRARHEEMAAIYNSADFFIQGSSREIGSGALLEAMACGVIPIVTEIPSFRAMTENGRYGRLFPLGDDESLAEQVLSIERPDISCLSEQIRFHFVEHLSFPALSRQLYSIYDELHRSSGLLTGN